MVYLTFTLKLNGSDTKKVEAKIPKMCYSAFTVFGLTLGENWSVN